MQPGFLSYFPNQKLEKLPFILLFFGGKFTLTYCSYVSIVVDDEQTWGDA